MYKRASCVWAHFNHQYASLLVIQGTKRCKYHGRPDSEREREILDRVSSVALTELGVAGSTARELYLHRGHPKIARQSREY